MSFGKAILCCQIWRGFRWGSHPISGSGELSTYGSAGVTWYQVPATSGPSNSTQWNLEEQIFFLYN